MGETEGGFTMMNWLFPYRTHLLAEIDYLKAQLAQAQRRADILQEALVKAAEKPAMRVQYKQDKETGKITPVQPRGWEEYRASQRIIPRTEEENAPSQ